jgi:hypothetical protein
VENAARSELRTTHLDLGLPTLAVQICNAHIVFLCDCVRRWAYNQVVVESHDEAVGIDRVMEMTIDGGGDVRGVVLFGH